MANSASGESVIDRVVAVLDSFTAERTSQSATEIARRAGLPLSTAHRLVSDLAAAGLLERDAEHRVRLGMRLWELALRGSTALRLRQAALPHMEWVQSQIRQHTQLAVLEHDEALFLERLSHPDAGDNIAVVAGRLPLHASSAGLVLLAHADPSLRQRVLAAPLTRVGPHTVTDPEALAALLARVRRTGVIVAPGSVEDASTGVAVPLRQQGGVVAALSVVLPRDTDPAATVTALRLAAGRIARDLRGDPTDA